MKTLNDEILLEKEGFYKLINLQKERKQIIEENLKKSNEEFN